MPSRSGVKEASSYLSLILPGSAPDASPHGITQAGPAMERPQHSTYAQEVLQLR